MSHDLEAMSRMYPQINHGMHFGRMPHLHSKAIRDNGGVWIETRKDVGLEWDIHYSDSRFANTERTIFGKEEDGLVYHYSDRMKQGDRYRRHEAAWRKACEEVPVLRDGHDRPVFTTNFYEHYLTAYWGGRQCTLKHIKGSFDPSTGDPYRVYGYTIAPDPNATEENVTDLTDH